jgi:hypothetical protein
MSYDEEGAFGAQTTFYGSRWVPFDQPSWLPQLLVTCTVQYSSTSHHDGLRADSIRIPRSSKNLLHTVTCNPLTHTLPVVIERYAVHMLVFFSVLIWEICHDSC